GRWDVGKRKAGAMSEGNGQKPAGYGHDRKGAAGGPATNEGRVHVTHKGSMDGVAGEGGKTTAKTFTIDDREVEIRDGETIWQAAQRLGTAIPHLCYAPEPGYRPDGNCRACMVEIEGERVLAASCIRTPAPGMKVKTGSDRAKASRKMVFELLISDQPERATAHDPASKFWAWADRMGIAVSRFPHDRRPVPDRSHPAMAGRGHGEKIVFDFDDPMGGSTCVACGECVQACPTGALMPATLVDQNNVRSAY